MKKNKLTWIALVCVAVAAFAFTACDDGSSGGNDPVTDSTQTTQGDGDSDTDTTQTSDGTQTQGDGTGTTQGGSESGDGSNITPAVTYIGAKAPTEAKSVGDIVFTDGSATAYSADLTLTAEQKEKTEAIVFYVGSADNVLGNRTLAVNVKNSGGTSYAWAKDNTTGFSTIFTDLQCERTVTKPESGMYYEYTYNNTTFYFTGDFDGSDNWAKVKEKDPAGTADDVVAENYPAFNYVNTELGENYYLPTLAELMELYKNIAAVNASITAVDGTTLSSFYWSSSPQALKATRAWIVSLSDGLTTTYDKALEVGDCVCGVRAF